MTGRLCLTRRHGQVIIIGPDITVEVVGLQNKHGKALNPQDFQVRLAVLAPREVVVDCAEVGSRRAKEGPN